ncbi:MAG: hypothetical protein AB2A00_23850 [Myxococcota bacterium]
MLGPVVLPCLLLLGAAPTTPAPPVTRTLAVFSLEPKVGVPKPVADLLSETLVAELRSSKAFARVVSPREIAVLMPAEQQKFLIQCASDQCGMVDEDLAGVLGVSHLLVGSLGRLGTSYLLNLRILELRTSVAVATVAERIKGQTDEALLDAMGPAVHKLLVDGGWAPEPQAPKDVVAAPSPAAEPTSAERSSPLKLARLGLRVLGGVGLVVGAVALLGGLTAAATAGTSVLAVRVPRSDHYVPQLQAAFAVGSVSALVSLALTVAFAGLGVTLLAASAAPL